MKHGEKKKYRLKNPYFGGKFQTLPTLFFLVLSQVNNKKGVTFWFQKSKS